MSVEIIQAEEELPEADVRGAVPETADADAELWDGEKEAKAAGLPARTVLNRDGTVEFTLRGEGLKVQVGSNVTPYTVIAFGRLKGKHMKDLLKASQDDFLARAMSHSTTLSQARSGLLLDEMDAADQRAVGQIVRFLQGAGDITGR